MKEIAIYYPGNHSTDDDDHHDQRERFVDNNMMWSFFRKTCRRWCVCGVGCRCVSSSQQSVNTFAKRSTGVGAAVALHDALLVL